MNKWLLIFPLMAMVSCSKDKSIEDGAIATLSETVTGKGWRITSIILTTDDGGFLDVFNVSFKDCEKDDILQFNSGGLFSLDDNTNKCIPQGSTVFVNLSGGSWVAQDRDSTLYINKGFNVQEYKTTQWTANSMTWKQSSTNYLGIKETLTFKLTR